MGQRCNMRHIDKPPRPSAAAKAEEQKTKPDQPKTKAKAKPEPKTKAKAKKGKGKGQGKHGTVAMQEDGGEGDHEGGWDAEEWEDDDY